MLKNEIKFAQILWILASWDLKSDFGELHQEELVDLLTLQSLFVNSRHLSLCRHCPLLKYSKCLVLSGFVATRS